MKESFGLSGDDAKQFRLQALYTYVSGAIVRTTSRYSTKIKTWDEVDIAVGDIAVNSAEAARDIVYPERGTVWSSHVGKGTVWDGVDNAAKDVSEKGGTLRQIVHAVCWSVITDRNKIIDDINDTLGSQVLSNPIGIETMSEICMTLMRFDDKDIEKLKLMIPLKMIDYLFAYERIISFLRMTNASADAGGGAAAALMDKHSQLVKRLGCENYYNKLTAPQYGLDVLIECLSMLPTDLVKIIVDYDRLCVKNFGDMEKIYERLLTLEF